MITKEQLEFRLQNLRNLYKTASPEERQKYILMAKPLQIALFKYTKKISKPIKASKPYRNALGQLLPWEEPEYIA